MIVVATQRGILGKNAQEKILFSTILIFMPRKYDYISFPLYPIEMIHGEMILEYMLILLKLP